MTENLSPEDINRKHGKPTWTCWGCKAETGLHWHNGWSVAMCENPECAAAFDAMCHAQEESAKAVRAYTKEYYGE